MQTKKEIISEDATAITCTLKYDPHSNQLFGIVFSINKRNGCSKVLISYEVQNESMIREHLKNRRAKNIHC